MTSRPRRARPSDAGAEMLARDFHEGYELLAPSFGYKTRKRSAVPWEKVPEDNRQLMIATAHHVIQKNQLQNCNRCGRWEHVEFPHQHQAEA